MFWQDSHYSYETSLNNTSTLPLPYSNITIWVYHYIELLVQLNLDKGPLKNDYFWQVVIFMKRLMFLSRNLKQYLTN